MAQKTYGLSLPVQNPQGTNLFDQVFSLASYPIAPNWSQGGQLIAGLSSDAPSPPYTILGYGFTFQGVFLNLGATLNGQSLPIFANLGKLYGGLMKNSGLGIGAGVFRDLPTDRSMIELLWNGQTDAPWPQLISSAPLDIGAQSMMAFKESLAQPVEIAEGDDLTIGLWLTPMLGQNLGVWVMNGKCSIVYDDHR